MFLSALLLMPVNKLKLFLCVLHLLTTFSFSFFVGRCVRTLNMFSLDIGLHEIGVHQMSRAVIVR
jgi:hypothetical protein